MKSIFISPITIFFIGLLVAFLGTMIGWYWKKRTEGTWKEDYQAIEKENKALSKKAKKSDKDNNRLKKQLETWKEKAVVGEKQYAEIKEEFKLESSASKETIQEKDKIIRQLESAHQNSKINYERLEKAHSKLNIKYKEDMADLKEWRKNRDSVNRATKDLRSRLKQAEEKNGSLKTANAKLNKEIEENRAFVSKLRALKARNNKLTEDLKYWEKKHYDCHHELATLKEQYELLDNRKQELALQTQSDAQTHQNMELKVQEFKDKFVEINDKYRRLLETKKSFGKVH